MSRYALLLIEVRPNGEVHTLARLEDPALVQAARDHARVTKGAAARVVPLRRIPRGPYAREGGSSGAD